MEKKNVKRMPWQYGLVVCFFLASFFFSSEASAQYYPPLVSNAAAQEMLESEVPSLIATSDALPIGSSAQIFAERKANLYNHTWELLGYGEALITALNQAYGEFAVDANGNKLNMDELLTIDIGSETNPDFGDAAFNNLVNFLRQ